MKGRFPLAATHLARWSVRPGLAMLVLAFGLGSTRGWALSQQLSSDKLALEMLSVLSEFRAGNVKEAALAWQHLAQDTLLVAKSHERDLKRLAGLAFVLASYAWQEIGEVRAFHAWQAGLETFLAVGLLWEDVVSEHMSRLEAITQGLASADLVSGALPGTPIKLDAEGLLWSELEKRLSISAYQGPQFKSDNLLQETLEATAEARSTVPIPLETTPSPEHQDDNSGEEGPEAFGEGIVQERGFRQDDRVTPELELDHALYINDSPAEVESESESPYTQTSPAFLEAIEEEFGEAGPDDASLPEVVVSVVDVQVSPAWESAGDEPPTASESETGLVDSPPLLETAGMMRDIFQIPPLGQASYVEPTWRVHNASARPLNRSEIKAAQTAWAYMVRNTQPQTGLVNSVEGYPFATMWDVGSGLAALVCARGLGILSQSEFEARMDRFLTTMESLPLYRGVLPNREYQTSTAQMTQLKNQTSSQGSGWSAIDLGRLLVWMAISRQFSPGHAKRIDQVVRGWNLREACQRGQLYGAFFDGNTEVVRQEGRLGYEQYAAGGFAMWKAPVTMALNLTFDRWVDLEGLTLPVDGRNLSYLTGEPFFLTMMEQGAPTPEFQRLAALVYDVQKRRWQKTAMVTAVSEDAVARYPWFVYNCILFNGKAWHCVDRNGFDRSALRSFSTKAAWAWSALILDEYAEKLGAKALMLQDENLGFYSGEFETGVPNESFNINTNAVVLEALFHFARAGKPFLEKEEVP